MSGAHRVVGCWGEACGHRGLEVKVLCVELLSAGPQPLGRDGKFKVESWRLARYTTLLFSHCHDTI